MRMWELDARMAEWDTAGGLTAFWNLDAMHERATQLADRWVRMTDLLLIEARTGQTETLEPDPVTR